MNVNVGDEVIVEGPSRGRRLERSIERVPVDRVARKYFYVRKGSWNELAFEISTGLERVKDPNYPQHNNSRAYTPQAYEEEMRSRDLWRRLRDYDVTFGVRGPFYRGLSDAAIEKILEILDAEVQS